MADRQGVERTVSRLAGGVALMVALVTPFAFAWHEFNQEVSHLKAEARLQADAITAFVGRNPTTWDLPTDRLHAVVEQNRTLRGGSRVTDMQGRVVLLAEPPLEWPVLVSRAQFHDFGSPAGFVEVSISGRGMLLRSLLVLAACVVLAALIYGPMRRIPLLAFDAATRDLQTSEARYRALVENAPVGIVKQRHGTIEFANRAFVSLVGANGAAELTGLDLLGLVAPEHRGEAAATVVALSTGPAFQAIRRLRLQRRDGSFIETEMTGLSSEENGAWAGQMIFVDVTEQRQAEERLRLSRDRLLEQQRTMSAVLCSEEFGRGGDEGVRLLTEVSAKYLDVDRVSLWRFDDDRHSLTCVDLYDRAAGRHRNGEILPVEQCPRYVEAIATEEAIVADDAVTDELTRELADDYLRPLGIGSLLDVPVRMGANVEGVFCHEHVGDPRFWTPEERMFAIAIGSLASLALERGARRQG